MILRRLHITRAVLRTLYWVGSQANRTTDGAYCASFLHKRWYEQSCLQRLWDANHAGVQAHAALVPDGVLRRASDGRGNLSGRSRFWQTPVLHAMGRGDVDRVKTLCNLCVFAVTLCASVARSSRKLDQVKDRRARERAADEETTTSRGQRRRDGSVVAVFVLAALPSLTDRT